MKTTPDISIADLRASLNGNVIGADDPGYDDARRVVFTGFDRRPAAIVRAADASDVSRVVTLARETGAELAVRSGGHSRAGHGTSEGGIVLDLSAMNAVEVDADGRTAWAQTGATAGDYTTATGAHGLATGLGDTPTVGLGGITLSGGIGFLVRRNGLTIDDLLAAEVVTADGELLEVDEETHADLFWALRGGGGNFGVATRLRLRLHEIDEVVGGMLMLPASADVITGLVAAADAAPEELSVIANILKAPPLPFIPAEHHGKPVVIALMVYAGGAEAGERAIAPIRALATPLADMVRPIRYPEMYAGPEGPRPAFDAGTNMLVDGLPARGGGGDPRAPRNRHRHDGRRPAARARRRDGARPRRRDRVRAPAGEADGEHRRHVRAPRGAPGARGLGEQPGERAVGWSPAAAYVGFLGDDGEEGVRRAYPPATLERLAQVKRRYDPDNLFRLNLNVPPEAT